MSDKCAVSGIPAHICTCIKCNPPKPKGMQRFTAFRRNLAQRGTHNAFQMNAEDQPQYEGVIFTDGRVVIRWLTMCGSSSVWDNLKDMLIIHGHPEYGTEIIWYDGPAPDEWLSMVEAARIAGTLPA